MHEINPTLLFLGTYEKSYCLALAKLIGVCPAILIRGLIQIQEKCKRFISDDKYGDGWFIATIDTVENHTGLEREEQTKAINKLIRLKVIEAEVFGLPAIRHFRIHNEKLDEIYGFRITRI